MTNKKQREQIMSDEDRIKAWKKHQRRCRYCRGQRPVETITDRLFGCCFECAGRDLTSEKVFESLPCIICGKKITPLYDTEKGVTQQTAEYTNMHGATSLRLDCGFGSVLDGNMYIAVCCDKCLQKAHKANRVTYIGNFISDLL